MTTPYIPGKFVWHELATPDLAKAQAFYQGLFGWTFKDVSHGDMPYHLILNGEVDIAGLWVIDADHTGKVAPHWGAYVSVADVDATAKLAVEAGGALVAGPYDLPQAGRMAILSDPSGASITAYHDNSGDPADDVNGIGHFVWDDLDSSDVEGAKAFYHKVFGWTTEPMGGFGDTFRRPDGVDCATIMGAQAGVPSHWSSYVGVADLAAARTKAKALGAAIILEELVVPEIGSYAVVQDPTGAYIRLFQAVAR